MCHTHFDHFRSHIRAENARKCAYLFRSAKEMCAFRRSLLAETTRASSQEMILSDGLHLIQSRNKFL